MQYTANFTAEKKILDGKYFIFLTVDQNKDSERVIV